MNTTNQDNHKMGWLVAAPRTVGDFSGKNHYLLKHPPVQSTTHHPQAEKWNPRILTEFRPEAQGWARCAYHGNTAPQRSQPQRGYAPLALPRAATPLGLRFFSPRFPRVARASQPWALLRNPVGIRRRRQWRNNALNRGNGQAKNHKMSPDEKQFSRDRAG